MFSNTKEGWGSLSKAFHWILAALIMLEVPAGYLMSYTYGLNYRDKGAALALHSLFAQIHHTNGFVILVLAIGRLAWRLHGPQPEPTPNRFACQHVLSLTTHGLLYGLLFLLPFTGWAALSVYGVAPIWLFNLKGVVPPILPAQPFTSSFGYATFARFHVYAVYAGGILVSIHVLAALWHHLVFKDDVLVRMWPLGRSQNQEPPAL